jgi:hypothetical protein
MTFDGAAVPTGPFFRSKRASGPGARDVVEAVDEAPRRETEPVFSGKNSFF